MQEQNWLSTLQRQLQHSINDHKIYGKADIILKSIMKSTSSIPNFYQSYAVNQSSLALFIFGATYKLLIKHQVVQQYNQDAYVLLLNLTLPYVSLNALKEANLCILLREEMFKLVQNYHKNSMLIRLAMSILNTLMVEISLQYDPSYDTAVKKIFNYAIQLPKSTILSKQSAKLLTILVKNKSNVIQILQIEAKSNLLTSLENHKQLYLNNIREIVLLFPYHIINDIGYNLGKSLTLMDSTDHNNECYLTQSYYFLEKIIQKLSISSIEQLINQFIHNVPFSTKNNKIIYCFLQTLHQLIIKLTQFHPKQANQLLSSVISIFQQFILHPGKVQKITISLLCSILNHCIRSNLWKINSYGIQDINLHSQHQHNFGKIICLMQSFLSNRFPNKNNSLNIICRFINNLQSDTFEECLSLIHKIIQFREELQNRDFKRTIHCIFKIMGVKKMLDTYPISLEGDVSSQTFESDNNLWMLHCLETYEGQESIELFMTYIVPLIIKLDSLSHQLPITVARKSAYDSINCICWRSFKVFCQYINLNINYDSILTLLNEYITSANEATIQQIAIGLQKLCENLFKAQYVSGLGEQLIKKLATLVQVDQNMSKQLLKTIRSLALITEKQYLHRVFDKNINKIIKNKQEDKITSIKQLNLNLKNLEILIAISIGINFMDSIIILPYNICRQQLVLRLINNFINEKNILQKKTYKYIQEILIYMPLSFTLEIIQLMQNQQYTINKNSKFYRISILLQLWKQLVSANSEQQIQRILNFIRNYIPQIIIAIKERNKKTRKQAISLFNMFYQQIKSYDILHDFIEVICAGFVSNQVEIKIDTLNALIIVFQKKDTSIGIDFLMEIIDIILILLQESKVQLYKAIVEFFKIVIPTFDFKIQQKLLPNIINKLFEVDEHCRLENRSILKYFLLRLVKKHGRQQIKQMIPVSDQKILINAIKVENRLKRNKRQKFINQKQYQKEKQKKDQVSQEEEDNNNDDSKNQINNNNKMEVQNNEKIYDLNNEQNLLLKYDLERQNFHFEQQKLNILSSNKKQYKKQLKNKQDITFTSDGIMIVPDDNKFIRQRQQFNNDNNPVEVNQDNSYKNVKKKVKIDTVHVVKESGQTFKSSKAQGDIKFRDKPDPYAFIQFNSKALNKRFKKKAEKVFDSIFERKQGGLKGVKSRMISKIH